MGTNNTMLSVRSRIMRYWLVLGLAATIACTDACGGRRGTKCGGSTNSRRRTPPPPPPPTIIEQKLIIRGRPASDEQLSSFQYAAETTYGANLGLWSSQAGRRQSDDTVTSAVAMTWITKRNVTTSGLVWTATATVAYRKAHPAWSRAQQLTAEVFTTYMRSMLIAGDLPGLHGGGVPNASAVDILPPQRREDEDPGWWDAASAVVGVVVLTICGCCGCAGIFLCIHACMAEHS